MFAYCGNNPIIFADSFGFFRAYSVAQTDTGDSDLIQELKRNPYVFTTSKKDETNFQKFINILEDMKNFDLSNEDINKVREAHYFSAYKGALVIKTILLDSSSFSFGAIVIGEEFSDNLLNHEYGHIVQFYTTDRFDYIVNVALPSAVYYWLYHNGHDFASYYGSFWEAEADYYGRVNRTYNNTPWTKEDYEKLYGFIKELFP